MVSEEDVKKGYQRAMFSMSRLNRTGGCLHEWVVGKFKKDLLISFGFNLNLF